ncbi:MAG: cell envelope integrity protein TolA [Gammaproteobacteria bacterium]|nr:MAG: cell envelope integrity protein TolA [Gammaproteobacteria bacterium]
MSQIRQRKYVIVSTSFHLLVLFLLIMGFDVTTPLPVFENTNKNDVISAVMLGDSTKSKILPQEQPPKPTPVVQPIVKKEVIALKPAEKKKIVDPNLLANDLLSDIKKTTDKQKKIKQKQLQAQFEKSLRQTVLNDDIKLQSTQSRQAQGEVDKYKALIMQAISERWIIPPQVDKKRSCELMIRVAPGGVVLDVQVTRSSGDVALDSSARAAVFKASPLPVPKDPDAFEAFRQFMLKVKPENVLSSNVT